MMLNNTTAHIRPRNPYEAIDLGTSMVRQWWQALWLIWFSVSLPFALFFWFVLYDYRTWAVFALWWLKPLWETPVLHFIAKKLFQGDTTAKQIIKTTPRLLMRDLLLKITVRRFSITRSFDMPVSELEHLKGAKRNKRLNVLHRTSSSAAIWLTVVGAHIESIIVFGFISLAWLFIPEYMAFNLDIFDLIIDEDYELYRFLFSYIAMSLIGPFYVACGFCLYINRRTILEGWDIEIRFKQLIQRVGHSTVGICAALMFTFIVGASAFPGNAIATEQPLQQQNTPELYTPKKSREDIINILESDDFNVIEMEEVYLRKDRHEPKEEDEQPDSALLEKLSKIFAMVAQSIEVILWGVFIALVIYLLIKLNQYRLTRAGRIKNKAPVSVPDSLFGLDLRKESLPENILEAAKNFWQKQQFREAYSLLYRGALIYIAHDKNIPLHESFTEEECVARFQEHDDGLAPLFFAQLTQQWQTVAYGHQIPGTSVFTTTYDGWHFHFSAQEVTHG